MTDISVKNGFQCGGFKYRVLFDEDTREEMASRGTYGNSSHSRGNVRIDPSIGVDHISNTFTHEILHVSDNIYLNGVLTEDQVVALANGLHQILESLGVRFVLE